MGGGIDAHDEWNEDHEKLNQLYGADTYVPKPPLPMGSEKPDYGDGPPVINEPASDTNNTTPIK